MEHLIGREFKDYVRFVWQAVTDPDRFDTFRRNQQYREVLEHVPEAVGRQYLNLIADTEVRELCLGSGFADKVGAPEVHLYGNSYLSPTTLRYGKVLDDLVKYFPRFRGMQSIAEIGAGYGGQARLISELLRRSNSGANSYTLIDLYPVVLLCREYLERFRLETRFQYWTRSEIPAAWSCDFVISNYAFSEFPKELQQDYLRLVLNRATSGYLTMNSGLQGPTGSFGRTHFSAQELVELLPNARILDEQPKTGPNNYVLVFGEHVLA